MCSTLLSEHQKLIISTLLTGMLMEPDTEVVPEFLISFQYVKAGITYASYIGQTLAAYSSDGIF